MASKRLKKKQQKKQLIQNLQQSNQIEKKKPKQRKRALSKVSQNKVNDYDSLSYNKLQQLYHEQQEKERKELDRKRNKEKNRKALRLAKFNTLVEMGIEPDSIPSSVLNHSWERVYKWAEEQQKSQFNFHSKRTLADGKYFYMAYRDYTGERGLEEIIKENNAKSDTELLRYLRELVNRPLTARPKQAGTSSGSAGDYRLTIGSKEDLQLFHREQVIDENKKERKNEYNNHFKRNPHAPHKGFQTLYSNGERFFNEYTPHKLLAVMCAFMENITELDRKSYYKNMYSYLSKHDSEFAKILPEPK